MNKVITVSLGGRAYQLEEGAHDKVRAYLDEAARRLASDPGRAEILSDLELALAEKCGRYLSPARNVVAEPEMEQILKEMGPVESSSGGEEKREEKAGPAPARIKRLYRLKDEGFFTGVCAGLAAYLGIDPAIVRLLFALLTVFTSGIWILVYIILVVIIPRAGSEEQKAAAFGDPFTARELVDQVKEQLEKPAEGHNWRHSLREAARRMRQERRERRNYMYPHGRLSSLPALFIVIGMAVSLAWLLGLAGLVGKGAAFGWNLPAGTPLWLGLLGWSCLYALVILPLRLARRGACCAAGAVSPRYCWTAAHVLFNIMLWTALIWALLHYVPGTQTFFNNLAALGTDFSGLFVAH